MKIRILLLLIGAFLFLNFNQFYRVSDIKAVVKEAQIVAVLPFEIIMTGEVPSELTKEELEQIQQNMSNGFQVTLFDMLVKKRQSKSKKVHLVNFQDYSITRNILQKNNLSLKDSCSLQPEQLAKLLGVDAVLKCTIGLEHYFTSINVVKFDIGKRIYDVTDTQDRYPVTDNEKSVHVEYTLFDGSDGVILWEISDEYYAEWSQQPDELVHKMNRNAVKRFPYQLK